MQVAISDRTNTLGEQLDDVQTQIAMAKNRLQVKRAKLKRSKRRQICRELRILELAQRDAEMHKLSRRLCKQNNGQTNRTYGRFPGRKLGKQTWEDFMKGPGDQGGCSAVVIDFEVERKKVMGEVIEDFRTGKRVLALDDKKLEARTDELIREVSKCLRKAPRRKAVPRWSVPSEIWLMLVCPNYQVKKTKRHRPVVRRIDFVHTSFFSTDTSTS